MSRYSRWACQKDTQRKKDLWMFIAEMSVSLRTLSNTSVNDLPLQFTLTKDNEYIHFYHADDVRLAEDMRITGIDLRVSKERDGMAPLLSFFPVRSVHHTRCR